MNMETLVKYSNNSRINNTADIFHRVPNLEVFKNISLNSEGPHVKRMTEKNNFLWMMCTWLESSPTRVMWLWVSSRVLSQFPKSSYFSLSAFISLGSIGMTLASSLLMKFLLDCTLSSYLTLNIVLNSVRPPCLLRKWSFLQGRNLVRSNENTSLFSTNNSTR